MQNYKNNTHKSWHDIIGSSLNLLDEEYVDFLQKNDTYFPDKNNFLNAFKTLPLEDTKYILFGQDPYPRKESAIGYAFIDGKVKSLFSDKGLSKEVNRATSLRNFLKMLLLCEGKLDNSDMSQQKISEIDKSPYIDTMEDIRVNLEKNGVLLLNMALVFTSKEDTKKHLKKWSVFIENLLEQISHKNIKLILFGEAAKTVQKFEISDDFEKIISPHPYNLSFITNKDINDLFKPMNLLKR